MKTLVHVRPGPFTPPPHLGAALGLLGRAFADTLAAIAGRSYLSAATCALLFLITLGLARGGEQGAGSSGPLGAAARDAHALRERAAGMLVRNVLLASGACRQPLRGLLLPVVRRRRRRGYRHGTHPQLAAQERAAPGQGR
jgi:hypothetical protein